MLAPLALAGAAAAYFLLRKKARKNPPHPGRRIAKARKRILRRYEKARRLIPIGAAHRKTRQLFRLADRSGSFKILRARNGRRNPLSAARIKAMTPAELAFARLDLWKVIRLQEAMKKAGHPVAKLGEYWDDLHGVMGEIRRRQGKNPHRRNPYPNEHAARLHAPGSFRPSTFRSKAIGKGIRIILAKRKGAPRGKRVADPTVVQAFRFSNALYTPGQARAWLAKHHVRPKRFEPATASQASTRRHLAKKSKRHIRRRRIA
jgi:hypothetical protein